MLPYLGHEFAVVRRSNSRSLKEVVGRQIVRLLKDMRKAEVPRNSIAGTSEQGAIHLYLSASSPIPQRALWF